MTGDIFLWLTQDGVIGGWGYTADPLDLPPRGWLAAWQNAVVWLARPTASALAAPVQLALPDDRP